MAKRIDYTIELLEKCKILFGNVIASGEYTEEDKENYRKSIEALKWVRMEQLKNRCKGKPVSDKSQTDTYERLQT